MSKCAPVIFSVIGQQIYLSAVFQQVIIQRKLGPVNDGISVIEIDAVYSEKNFVKIIFFQTLYCIFIQSFDVILSCMDRAAEKQDREMRVGSKLDHSSDIGGYDRDIFLYCFRSGICTADCMSYLHRQKGYHWN